MEIGSQLKSGGQHRGYDLITSDVSNGSVIKSKDIPKQRIKEHIKIAVDEHLHWRKNDIKSSVALCPLTERPLQHDWTLYCIKSRPQHHIRAAIGIILVKMSKLTLPIIPSRHRALVLHSTRDPYDMSVVETETPKAEMGSAVVRVLAAAVLTYANRVYSGRKPYLYPKSFVPGSSAVGRVVDVGQDATKLKPEQLIYFDTYVQGRDDTTALFLHGLSGGFTPGSNKLMETVWRDSTYAEYAKLPLENCFPLDEARLLGSPAEGGLGYSFSDLVYLFTISIPFGGLRDVDVKAGEKVVISPATGAFGSAAVFSALAMGARVVAMSRTLSSLEPLKQLGFGDRIQFVQNTGDVETDVKELTKDGPADVFFDISPGAAIKSTHFKSCIQSLRRGGRVSLMGAHQELTLPTQFIMLYDITIKGKWMYTKEDMRVMINLVETGYLKLGEVGGIKTVGTFPLEEFDAAFDAASKMRGSGLQVVIVP